jgi:O-antigen ligase
MHALLARWSDVGKFDKAGSGRATFWKVAVNAYVAEDLPQQTFGIGYKAMSEMLFRDYGDDIKHTHNDMLDLLLVGGFAGAIWLVSLVGAFAWRAVLASPRSTTGAAAVAIFLAYLCHSQLTGQIWGTDAMTYYTVSLTCLTRMTHQSLVSAPVCNTTSSRSEVMAQI